MAWNSIMYLFNGIRSLPGISVLHSLFISTRYVKVPNFIYFKSSPILTSVLPHSMPLAPLSSLLKIIRFARIPFSPAGSSSTVVRININLNMVYIRDYCPLVLLTSSRTAVQCYYPALGVIMIFTIAQHPGPVDLCVLQEGSNNIAVLDFFWYVLNEYSTFVRRHRY